MTSSDRTLERDWTQDGQGSRRFDGPDRCVTIHLDNMTMWWHVYFRGWGLSRVRQFDNESAANEAFDFLRDLTIEDFAMLTINGESIFEKFRY